MNKSSLIISLLFAAVFGTVLAQKKEQAKTWSEKAAARFGDKPSAKDKEEIAANIPEATKIPQSDRKVLVFWRCEGFIHTSIPFGNYALEQIAEQTGAFTIELADEYGVFTKKNLAAYDAILFNNTTNLVPNESQQEAILDFIRSGKGIVGLHAAADNFKKWEEGIALMGGVFDGHPWTAGGTWAFKLDDPKNSLNAAFDGEGFWHKDEIYWYKPDSFQGRDRLRVLLSLDMSHPQNAVPLKNEKFKAKVPADPTNLDVPVSWCREVGKGRLFYTNLGHNDMTFANKTVLTHILDGIQFALGDLEADAIPSSEAKLSAVKAPKKSD